MLRLLFPPPACAVFLRNQPVSIVICFEIRLQGEEYVNSRTLTDVTFHVEGRPFYAHRIALLASSEAFRAMFGQVRGEAVARAQRLRPRRLLLCCPSCGCSPSLPAIPRTL
jgi:hypothetical protein